MQWNWIKEYVTLIGLCMCVKTGYSTIDITVKCPDWYQFHIIVSITENFLGVIQFNLLKLEILYGKQWDVNRSNILKIILWLQVCRGRLVCMVHKVWDRDSRASYHKTGTKVEHQGRTIQACCDGWRCWWCWTCRYYWQLSWTWRQQDIL